MMVPEITPDELARALEAGDPVQVLDVRAPQRLAAGRIELAPEDRFHNIVGSRIVQMRSADETGLDAAAPVAVVCGHGNDSKVVATLLNRFGFEAASLHGGMAGWNLLTLPRELPATDSLDRLVQFDRMGKAALGYLLVSDGEAMVVDAPREFSTYLAAADEADAQIVAVADTHCHADYISGGPHLARALGAPYYLHEADSSYPYDGTPGRLRFEPLEDGTSIRVGRATVRVQRTPGHTEGSVTFLVDEQAAFTGDFIFVASIGRPDLAGKSAEWTVQLWDSLAAAKSDWPADVAIYPAHYALEEERNADRSVGRPLGELLRTNEPLAIGDRGTFVQWVEARTGTFPEQYRVIKAVNVGLTPVTELQAEELEMGKNECALG
jgi:glyoxylase-like metal-dependent hydrolase (beta-lactamase superfamily II)